jgi:hypothetical protein
MRNQVKMCRIDTHSKRQRQENGCPVLIVADIREMTPKQANLPP